MLLNDIKAARAPEKTRPEDSLKAQFPYPSSAQCQILRRLLRRLLYSQPFLQAASAMLALTIQALLWTPMHSMIPSRVSPESLPLTFNHSQSAVSGGVEDIPRSAISVKFVPQAKIRTNHIRRNIIRVIKAQVLEDVASRSIIYEGKLVT
jgi:hypothetical protein